MPDKIIGCSYFSRYLLRQMWSPTIPRSGDAIGLMTLTILSNGSLERETRTA